MAEQLPDIATALTQLRARIADYQLYHDYADGRHRLAFATEKYRNAFGSLFRAFADNLCSGVVDAVADRLIVTGFTVEQGPESVAKDAWTIWTANRMGQRAGEVHAEALTAGDAYVIVWLDAEGNVTIYPQGAANVTVRYDPETPGRLLWAAKVWITGDKRYRLNLYYPDRIEKYITRGSSEAGLPTNSNGFVPFEVPGESWPLTHNFGHVPVFHFANNARVGRFGRSELADIVPLQDALNKAIADMLVAMEFVALPQRWATGLEVEIDEATGKPRAPFVPGADRIWSVASEETRFGQFDPADLGQFLEVQEKFRKEIATVSRTPMHFIVPPAGQWPSGEALRSAESALLKKVWDRQIAFGNVWEDVMRFALRVAGKPDAVLSCQWEDPTPRVALEMVQVALIKQQLGVSQQRILSELGYSPREIEQMQAEAEENADVAASTAARAYNRGA